MNPDTALGLGLRLPETHEQDHHGMRSLRIGSKVLATIPDPDHMRIMADESAILSAVAEYPEICVEGWWGTRLACVVVDLRLAQTDLVEELLDDAWRHKTGRFDIPNS
ncbi:MAG: MmcQ/YjbR family DNA-binding protein [Acidimicrobiia bacterium]